MNPEDGFFIDPCDICLVRPICSIECGKSKSYEILVTFLEWSDCIPNEKEIKENGLTIITGENNGRTKRRKDRKNIRKTLKETKK